MNLIDILKQQAEFTRNSGVEVKVDSAIGTVSIFETANPDCCVFLQGSVGDQWIENTKALWETVQNLDMETVELSQAYEYLDILWEM